ncbi:MAG: hypothetical protein ABFR05_02885 [Bacteroidota bacterium]
MKVFLRIIIIGIIIGSLFSSCTSPQKLLDKGNYYDAVLLSVEKLKKNPNNKNAKETLEQAYPLAVESLLSKIEKNNLIQPRFANSQAAYTYEDLNRLYEKIQQSPAAKQIIRNPENYYGQLAKVKALAAEEQYSAGVEQLGLGSRENARQAYYYFQDADAFVKNYKDVPEKLEQSYNMALLHVITDFKPVHSKMYGLSAATFYDELNNNLQQIEKNQFVRFYSVNEANKINFTNPDQYLEINFEDFIVGETHTVERIKNMQADSVKVGEVTLDDRTKKDVYGTVKAKVIISRMEVISKGLVNLTITQNINDQRGLLNQNFPGEYVWFNEWGHFNGDERALTGNQYEICRRREMPPPPPQQMFLEFTKPILSQLGKRLEYFYRDY